MTELDPTPVHRCSQVDGGERDPVRHRALGIEKAVTALPDSKTSVFRKSKLGSRYSCAFSGIWTCVPSPIVSEPW